VLGRAIDSRPAGDDGTATPDNVTVVRRPVAPTDVPTFDRRETKCLELHASDEK